MSHDRSTTTMHVITLEQTRLNIGKERARDLDGPHTASPRAPTVARTTVNSAFLYVHRAQNAAIRVLPLGQGKGMDFPLDKLAILGVYTQVDGSLPTSKILPSFGKTWSSVRAADHECSRHMCECRFDLKKLVQAPFLLVTALSSPLLDPPPHTTWSTTN